ncbi:MAG: hypothetical protein JJU06_18905 [Ectothiorhodospiraceae bacterium]|nr:hypothetical protein [Ectothiorhodospiraceae bacterium]MCH8505471.1 hypothetical protein [Ectothiorhodospiraceae bacterium]
MKHRLIRVTPAFVVAVAVTAVLSSIAQTQYNMLALTAMGVLVPPGTWLQVVLRDLVGFAPIYAIVVAVAFLLAFIVAAQLARWLPRQRMVLFMLAGAAGILAAVLLINGLAPMTPVAITRYLTGTAILCGAGAVGGWVYMLLAGVPQRASLTGAPCLNGFLKQ